MQMLCDWLRSEPPAGGGTLRLAMLSGDWIPVALPDEARAIFPGLDVVALGGATEGSIWSIAHPIGDVDTARPSIPYGRPLTNQYFAVLDHAMRPRPDWVTGELYIGGAGVAMGYLNDDSRTAERFVTDPADGARIYRTGDLGRYLPDGTIEFLGREDAQVKIRGYRVELSEVEAAVQAHPAVAGGAVIVDDSAPGGRRLAAFVETARQDPGASGSEAAARVRQAAAEAVQRASAEVDAERLAAYLDVLDEVALSVLSRVLSGAGLFAGAAAHTADDVCFELRSTPRHRRVVFRWLRVLTARNRLTFDAETGTFSLLRPVSTAELEDAWRRAADLEREVRWSTDLLAVMRTCAHRLAELVAGDIDIRTLLFPGAHTDAADAACRDNLAIRHLNQAVVAAVREIAAGHTGEERLRVLEVGGGVAGTTGELVPVLAEFGVDYLFTDASTFFLDEARERFADHPWVRCERLDLDEDIREQGFAPNSFDVVVCANALHAASDAEAAMARLRELLVPRGHVVFVENTRDDLAPLLVSMEFLEVAGRTRTDPREHDGQSFLTAAQWLEVLAGQGAAGVVSFPEPGDPLAATGQRLFLARMKTDRVHTTVGELVRGTSTRLPGYMVPSKWQIVDALPRTANGKVDRNALITMARSRPVTTGHVAPPRGRAAIVARLWSEVLGLDQVGTQDNFFDLGGDSRSVAALVVRLNGSFDTRMRVVDFMSAPTVAKICEWIDHASTVPGDGPARPGQDRNLRDHVAQRAASRTRRGR
jgi:pyochelin synthetase